jgi:hypothetical protein
MPEDSVAIKPILKWRGIVVWVRPQCRRIAGPLAAAHMAYLPSVAQYRGDNQRSETPLIGIEECGQSVGRRRVSHAAGGAGVMSTQEVG